MRYQYRRVIVIIDFKRHSGRRRSTEGGTAENYAVWLGQAKCCRTEAAIIGTERQKIQTVIRYDFPEDYPRQDVAGKAVTFKNPGQSIAEPLVPEIDSEFAKGVGRGRW